jgi:hypothetical protein
MLPNRDPAAALARDVTALGNGAAPYWKGPRGNIKGRVEMDREIFRTV